MPIQKFRGPLFRRRGSRSPGERLARTRWPDTIPGSGAGPTASTSRTYSVSASTGASISTGRHWSRS